MRPDLSKGDKILKNNLSLKEMLYCLSNWSVFTGFLRVRKDQTSTADLAGSVERLSLLTKMLEIRTEPHARSPFKNTPVIFFSSSCVFTTKY